MSMWPHAMFGGGLIGLVAWAQAMSFVAETMPVLPQEYALTVRLPCACCPGHEEPDVEFDIRVEEDGSICVADEPVEREGSELLDTLRGIGETFERPACLVMMSDSVSYQRMIDVLDALKAAGITDVALISLDAAEVVSRRRFEPPVALLPMAPFPR